MRNPTMQALREAVRAEIGHAFELVGYARPREVARVVCALLPGDVQAIGARLAEDALTDVARRELKKNTQSRDSANQLQLPGVPQTLVAQLPTAISIPFEGDAADEDDEGVIYKPLAQATLADVDAHLQLLSKMIGALTHLQHVRGKHVIFVAILDEKLDDFNRKVFVPQIDGSKTALELPGIVDEVITLTELKTDEGEAYRAFVCQTLNPWGLPAKDRSGRLALIEPPHLGQLIAKCGEAQTQTSARHALATTLPTESKE